MSGKGPRYYCNGCGIDMVYCELCDKCKKKEEEVISGSDSETERIDGSSNMKTINITGTASGSTSASTPLEKEDDDFSAFRKWRDNEEKNIREGKSENELCFCGCVIHKGAGHPTNGCHCIKENKKYDGEARIEQLMNSSISARELPPVHLYSSSSSSSTQTRHNPTAQSEEECDKCIDNKIKNMKFVERLCDTMNKICPTVEQVKEEDPNYPRLWDTCPENPNSDIKGNGWGACHNWKIMRYANVNEFSKFKSSIFQCRTCYIVFVHKYDIIPNIHEAMKKKSVLPFCDKPINIELVKKLGDLTLNNEIERQKNHETKVILVRMKLDTCANQQEFDKILKDNEMLVSNSDLE